MSGGVMNDLVRAALCRPGGISRKYDIPYVAGYSVDARTIFIDLAHAAGTPASYRPRYCLRLFEKALLDQLRSIISTPTRSRCVRLSIDEKTGIQALHVGNLLGAIVTLPLKNHLLGDLRLLATNTSSTIDTPAVPRRCPATGTRMFAQPRVRQAVSSFERK
jgi:hypothetical protein